MPYDICERSFQFAKNVVLFINSVPYRSHISIVDQLLRSATSIGANIIEGRSGNSRKNLVNFYSIALRSANETYYWLRLLSVTSSNNEKTLELLTTECKEISKILAKSIITLKNNDRKIK
ncbi:MAG TPA: four helix bundle protein [Flavitalea sp.]|nr:four helix bundle protein [Flavitalea sp.]